MSAYREYKYTVSLLIDPDDWSAIREVPLSRLKNDIKIYLEGILADSFSQVTVRQQSGVCDYC